ncbi:MAG: sodium:solute symporter family protein [Planctomycetales bacterium]|nr:sodium:solute symporter family protein [Planctomycetales bacterium]
MIVILGLKLIDLIVIVGYFAVVMVIGFWASAKVHNDEDFFLGGRRFGKGLLVMHWLCTGTHSDMAVQVAGASARVGLGGIWYQWMWLFSTPFYWLIAPMIRRLRLITTGDLFRVRYGRGLELVYSLVALAYLVLSIALLLRGAGSAIAGATGGVIPTQHSVIVLAVLFSSYIMAGGLMAAAYTDFLQGVMIIVLSFLLVPVGLDAIGGMAALHEKLGPAMLAVTAPPGTKEGNVWFVLSMSLLGLSGIVAQPHVMTSTGSGKTELEARVGMTYGNFIKRLLTIAWTFTGLIAAVLFADQLNGLKPGSEAAHQVSETLFGRAIQSLLGDGWRGLMIACIVAGVTSAETIMVVGAGVMTRNFYMHLAGEADARHLLWAGRVCSAVMLVAGIIAAVTATSVTQLLTASVQVIGLMGPAIWLGVTWRRANPSGAWASLIAGLCVWGATSVPAAWFKWLPALEELLVSGSQISKPAQILLMLVAQFGALIVVSLLTKPQPASLLDPFFARLLTPVGTEDENSCMTEPAEHAEQATLGLHGKSLDYSRVSKFASPTWRRLGFEIPRFTLLDWGGFVAAWGMVAALIGLLVWLAGLGRPSV